LARIVACMRGLLISFCTKVGGKATPVAATLAATKLLRDGENSGTDMAGTPDVVLSSKAKTTGDHRLNRPFENILGVRPSGTLVRKRMKE
jgi:hypothetical protein